MLLTVTDVSTTCAVIIFTVKVSCITSVDSIMSIIPSNDVIKLTLTLKMTIAQVVETSVIVTKKNSPVQDYVHPDNKTRPTFGMTSGFDLSQGIQNW